MRKKKPNKPPPSGSAAGPPNGERFFEEVMSAIQEGISILNPDLTIRRVNPMINRWYRDNLPLEGKKCFQAYHNRNSPCDPCPTLRCLKTGRPEIEVVKGLPGSPTKRLELYSCPVKDSENGEITGVVEFVRDITEHKRAEEKIRKEHRQLLSLFESIDQPIYVSDMDTYEILFANRALREKFGSPLVGKICYRELGGLDRPCDFCTNRIIRELAGQPYSWEHYNPKLGCDFQIIDRVIKWPDGRDVRFELAIDITERKEAEARRLEMERQVQQTQKLESLGVLAGGIAHDFNNILMVILGHTELALEDTPASSPTRRNLKEISSAVHQAAGLCRQMLAYAGKSTPARVPLDLNALIGETETLLRASVSKKAVLTFRRQEGLPPLEADASQIRQVVLNLVINASEALGKKSGYITLSTGAEYCGERELQEAELADHPEPGFYVFLEVSDTGMGMDRKIQRRIFEPFFSTKLKGRGLGLAAVLGIIRGHRGAVRIESSPGKGTIFRILFPALEIELPAAPGGEAVPAGARRQWQGEGTVLLAEDEESLRALGIRALKKLGLEVLAGADGGEAVELYRKHRQEIDLVILDLTMPVLDGREVLEIIRKINPAVRVVISSGHGEGELSADFDRRGLEGVLSKPYSLDRLRALLSRLLPPAAGSTSEGTPQGGDANER